MSNLSAFFAQNKVKTPNIKYAASKSFQDANGNPIEWELKKLESTETEAMKRSCRRKVKVGNNYETEQDMDLFSLKTAAAAVVFPDLNNAELQDSYGVMGAENLLKRMLSPGELQKLYFKVGELCDFGNDEETELYEEAKN